MACCLLGPSESPGHGDPIDSLSPHRRLIEGIASRMVGELPRRFPAPIRGV